MLVVSRRRSTASASTAARPSPPSTTPCAGDWRICARRWGGERSIPPQCRPQFLERGAHLCFDGADRSVALGGDLVVGQIAVLAQQEDFALVGAKTGQRL